MRMYSIHFGHGMEHTQIFTDYSKGNMPYLFTGWDNSSGAVTIGSCDNGQIVSHKEILDRYGVKGGHGQYCLETWSHDVDSPTNACRLYTGGYGHTNVYGESVKPFYLKFDFMYTETSGGNVLLLQRTKTGIGDRDSEDLKLYLNNGLLEVSGSKHITQPNTDPPTFLFDAWMKREDNRYGSIYLAPDKWHEIQVFISPYHGWGTSEVGGTPIGIGYHSVDVFKTFFEAYEQSPGNPPEIPGAEARASVGYYPLQMDEWPSNGHPKFPNAMLPGQDQTSWPPENYGSGQYFYGEKLGLVYVWVNGQLDIQHSTNMSNEQTGWTSAYSEQSIFFGSYVRSSDSTDDTSGRFFYDNIIWNDIRDPSGSYPSKIFNPLFSSDNSLEWDPGYSLKFTSMEIDPDFWEDDALGTPNGRKHNTWYPEYPKGALVPSGDPYFVNAPHRYGSPTDSMIPHGTKLTPVYVDADGEEQDYIVYHGNASLYPDNDIDFAYQHVQPEESNVFTVNQGMPRLTSSVSGNASLFYLKRPIPSSGKQPLAGGHGLGGVHNYVPNIDTSIGINDLPPIYRIWTCIQDHTIGSNTPIDTQYHMVRVPSGVDDHVDYISDHQCPGDRGYRSYHNGTAALTNGYSMADWPYNPVTGNPWTWEDIDDLQIGVFHGSHSTSNSVNAYVIYLVIEHGTAQNTNSDILDTNLIEWSVADDIPFILQQKAMYHLGWRQYEKGEKYTYYNRWDINPDIEINKTHTQTSDGQATISTPRYSGTIEYDYRIKYINGELVDDDYYRQFDEHFGEVWVYTTSGYSPSMPIRHPFRGEVITDCDGDHFTFLTHPVLQYNQQKYPTDENLSPIDHYPYVVYDYDVFYVTPLHLDSESVDGNMLGLPQDPNNRPSISGVLGTNWTINKAKNVFNFRVDKDSYFNVFSPSSVINHEATYPNEDIDDTFLDARSGHSYYFRAPHLPSGSVSQIIYLTDKFGLQPIAIDNEIYQAHIGLYQNTADQISNDTGEGRFDFYSGDPSPGTLISGYTFGADSTAGWHLNQDTIIIPSGTRQVKFTFIALRNTPGDKSPGSTLGGTSNFASFDEPFFKISNISNTNTYHPADTNQDNRIGNDELSDYMLLWQSGMLPTGQSKGYLDKAEKIWKSGVSDYFADPSGGKYYDSGGPRPDRWLGSGYIGV